MGARSTAQGRDQGPRPVRTAAAVVAATLLFTGCALPAAGQADGDPAGEAARWAAAVPNSKLGEIEDRLAQQPQAAPGVRAVLLFALCDAYGRVGRYRKAQEACEQGAVANPGPSSPGAARSIAFWKSLAAQEPLSVKGSIDAPLTESWNGMGLLQGQVDGESIPWAIDTGAEVSVLRASEARRLGVRMISTSVAVAGTAAATAEGGLGMLDRLVIDGAEIRNLPVLVAPDAALRVGDQFVPAILGMPVFYAFGSVEFLDFGARLRTGVRPLRRGGERLTWTTAGVAFPVGLPRGPVTVHLDTGANRTELAAHSVGLLSAAERMDLETRSIGASDIAGATRRDVSVARRLDIRIGRRVCRLREVWFGSDLAGEAGRAGFDLVRGCRRLALDFEAMRVWAE